MDLHTKGGMGLTRGRDYIVNPSVWEQPGLLPF